MQLPKARYLISIVIVPMIGLHLAQLYFKEQRNIKTQEIINEQRKKQS
jgi:hypothetical protein